MGIVSAPPFEYPYFGLRAGNSNLQQLVTGSNVLIDAAGEKAAVVLNAPATGTISKVGFRVNAVPSAGNADVRLETVDLTTGDPTGTLLGTNTNATQAISGANTWYTTTLTAGATVTREDLFAVVIVNSTGQYNIAYQNGSWGYSGFPYVDHLTAAWAKITVGGPQLALEYNDGSYSQIMNILPQPTPSLISLNNGSTPDEIGAKFTLPVGMRASGIYVSIDVDEAVDLVLYDAASTALATVSLDKDLRMTNTASYQARRFPTAVSLAANATYRVAVKPTTATNVGVPVTDVPSAAFMGAMPGGVDWVYTSRTDAGAWSETTTRYAPIGLIIDGIDRKSRVIGG